MRAPITLLVAAALLANWPACPAAAPASADSTRPPPPAAPPRLGAGPPGAMDLDAFLTLPPAERAARRRQADELYSRWEKFETVARRSRAHWNAASGGSGHPSTEETSYLAEDLGTGLLAALQRLSQATARDPSHARAWLALGRLRLDTGAYAPARHALLAAERAAEAAPEGTNRARHDLRLDILRRLGWTARQEGAWEDGLRDVERGLRLAPKDPELTLVRGLLLAGAGRFVEACAVARELPPFEYRVYGSYRQGLGRSRSDYGSRWIQAMAYLHAGEPRLALYVLGELHPRRREMPFMSRYWQDVGLVFELNDRPDEAGTFYGIALVSAPWFGYYPWAGFSTQPRILGRPDPRLPAFVTWEQRRLSGSPFAYAAQLAAECAADPAGERAPLLAALADSALSICLRWNVDATCARAVRGEMYCALGRNEAAEAELARAHQELTARGWRDARTSLLLGMLMLEGGRFAPAIGLLRESTLVDSTVAVAWRSLGVALAEAGQFGEAEAAMGRGIALDPGAAEGWYNRALLRLRKHRKAEAALDLRVAIELDPENADIASAMTAAAPRTPGADAEPPVVDAPAAAAAPTVGAAPEGKPAAPEVATEPVTARYSRPARAGGGAFTRVPQGLPDTSATRAADMRELERAYQARPDPASRAVLAALYLRTGMAGKTLDLLLPAWQRDLSPEEMRLVVQAERLQGQSKRAIELGRGVDPAHPEPPDPDLWALVAIVCHDNGADDEGRRALDAALKLAPDNTGLKLYDSLLRRER